MVRTRIPQRAVTQQPRQKGNVAPWTGDLCLSGSGGLGSSQKGALRFRPGIIGYPLKGADRRINGLGSERAKEKPQPAKARAFGRSDEGDSQILDPWPSS
jgi:hypothetical protein